MLLHRSVSLIFFLCLSRSQCQANTSLPFEKQVLHNELPNRAIRSAHLCVVIFGEILVKILPGIYCGNLVARLAICLA